MFAPRAWLRRKVARAAYELFRESRYFDAPWYRKNQLRGLSKIQDPIWHYIALGWREHLAPSPLFDPEYYETKNDDVRAARINPLHHYLAHGRAEQRLPLRSAKETIDYYLPDAADLRTFLTPSLGQHRVSILLDSLSAENLDSKTGDALSLAAKIALQRKATLRVLYRGIEIDAAEISRALDPFGAEFLRSLEITRAPNTRAYSDIPFFDDEVSLATSWSSAQAMRFASDGPSSLVLVTAGSAPADGEDHSSLAPKASLLPGIALARNTRELREAWRNQVMPLPTKAPDNLAQAFELAPGQGGPWRLGVIATPQSNPGNYALTIEAITQWLTRTHPDECPVQIFFVSEEPKPLSFLEEIQPVFLGLEGSGKPAAKVHAVMVLAAECSDFADDLCSRGVNVVSSSTGQTEPSLTIDPSGAARFAAPPSASEIARGLEALHHRFTELAESRR